MLANKEDNLRLGFAALGRREYLLLWTVPFSMEIGISLGQIAQPRGFNSWVWTSISHPALALTFRVTLRGKKYYRHISIQFPLGAQQALMPIKSKKWRLFKGKTGFACPNLQDGQKSPKQQRLLLEPWHLMAPN